ncbi:hypothetical protein IC582_009048 [Cucumis melo]
MACNSSACQSNCYRNQHDEHTIEQDSPPSSRPGTAAVGESRITNDDNSNTNLCFKCKSKERMSTSGVGDDGRLCSDCFRSNLFAKFRQAVTSNAMISPSDKVLVAFSGGPCSRVALQFVHEIQVKAHKNFEASRDRSLQVFGVGVAYINETAAYSIPSDEIDKTIQTIQSVVSSLSQPRKDLHIVPIESVYSSNLSDGREKLKKLLDAVDDVTGKEDLISYLRMLSLQKIAAENGYNRLLVGTCTSRIACHVISSTVKGQGYSLPADVQYIDARWEVPVVLPLLDCLAQELNMLCCIDGSGSLKTVELTKKSSSGINDLVSSFVALLQVENPSRESTIVRTAGKLTPFNFSRIPDLNESNNVPLATKRRQKRNNFKHVNSLSSESFCAVCNGPLNTSDVQTRHASSSILGACCSSCQFQILPKDSLSHELFLSLLPPSMVARATHGSLGNSNSLRNKIQEFLLSDDDAES